MKHDSNNKKEGHKDKATHANTIKGIPFNKGWDEVNYGVVVDKWDNLNLSATNYHKPTPIPTSDNVIVNTGASSHYLSADTPHSDKNLYIEELLVVGNK